MKQFHISIILITLQHINALDKIKYPLKPKRLADKKNSSRIRLSYNPVLKAIKLSLAQFLLVIFISFSLVDERILASSFRTHSIFKQEF
jgi:hypothetical protein